MIHLALIRRPGAARGAARARARHAAYLDESEALRRKDFSAVPVCGSVRPLASQRAKAVAKGD
ncbi:hypothetical protein [Pedococcus bigeumensis]|uniref:Uncharacterized protein n=1 Tax=Pedococcus bigeumensis TaxID=433644 RepID=A0A502CXE3_9MICO|nr:hypothetical protein [Pedococcus bigeumensis]TPG17334.1 hypothetical protein EAH86_11380 [Pedococcus bigeumensis]